MALQLILSTVGASLYNNILNRGERDQGWAKKLLDMANVAAADMPADIVAKLDELSRRAKDSLERGSARERRRLSAELNGIYGIYADRLDHQSNDMHWLIATDTALGQIAAGIVRDHLSEQGLNVAIYTPPKLSTLDTRHFGEGVKALIAWCEDTLPDYHSSGYKVVFNLVASFKSLQGYLNTIGMFYADEIVYIFEGPTSDLIRIPRLPIAVDLTHVHAHAVNMALMEEGHLFPKAVTTDWDLPESLLYDDGQYVTLSEWGELIWNRSKRDILGGESLLDFPKLEYTADFRKDYRDATTDDRVHVQEALAKASKWLMEANGNTALLKSNGGLQYDNYTGRLASDQSPIGHFRVNQGRRVSCVSHSGRLVMRHFGPHDYVNSNP